MELNELMVGDWVFDKKTKQPRKISGTNDLLFHDDYDPIPLTEEILVKNGFEKFAESQTYFDYTDNDIHLEYWIGDGCFRYYTAEIHYVHQLQHLLRLCGIEKSIIL